MKFKRDEVWLDSAGREWRIICLDAMSDGELRVVGIDNRPNVNGTARWFTPDDPWLVQQVEPLREFTVARSDPDDLWMECNTAAANPKWQTMRVREVRD